MKFIKIAIILAVLGTSVAKAQFTTAELQVSGLTCSICSKATEKSLRTLGFIGDIKPDLNRNLYIITFKKDAPVNLQAISKKVQGAGFSVNSLKVVFNFDNVKVDNNQFSFEGSTYQFVKTPEKSLTGPVSLTVMDKGFVAPSAFKKYAGQYPDLNKTGVLHLSI
jgi:copper chaperone CopZ